MSLQARVTREALLDGLKWAMHAVPARPPMMVLQGVLLRMTDDTLVVSGYSYDEYAAARVAARGTGEVLVPGALMLRLITETPAKAEIDLAVIDESLHIDAGDVTFHVPLLPLADYPTQPEVGIVVAEMTGTDMDLIVRTTVAAGRDDTLPVLTGVQIEARDGKIECAGTDRYRLIAALTDAKVLATWTEGQSHLIPARLIRRAGKALVKARQVHMVMSGTGSGERRWVGFQDADGSRLFACLPLEGTFPNWRSLMPTETPGKMEVDKQALIDGARRVAAVAYRNGPAHLDITTERLVLHSGNANRNDDAYAESRIPALMSGDNVGLLFEKPADGPRGTGVFKIALQPQYVLDAAAVLDGSAITVAFQGPTRPAIFTGSGPLRYLLMPVRLSG